MLNFKNFIKFFILMFKVFIIDKIFLNFFVKSTKKEKKVIVLFFPDAIGDYLLFRNFFEEFRNYYSDCFIRLIGRDEWKDLALNLDKHLIDEFIFIKLSKFNKNLIYRLKKIKEINNCSNDIFINCSIVKDFKIGAFFVNYPFVKCTKAHQKMCSLVKCNENKNKPYFILQNRAYSNHIFININKPTFLFYKNKLFIENLLMRDVKINKPFLVLEQCYRPHVSIKKNENYCVFFIGASTKNRQWSIKNFAEIAKYIKKYFNFNIFLLGGEKEIEEAKEFERHFTSNYINLVGKLKLIELPYVLKDAKLVITNDTFLQHLVVSLQQEIPLIVISRGHSYYHCIPYPIEIYKDYYAVFPKKFADNKEKFLKMIYCNTETTTDLDINSIEIEDVIKAVNDALKLNN